MFPFKKKNLSFLSAMIIFQAYFQDVLEHTTIIIQNTEMMPLYGTSFLSLKHAITLYFSHS